jgi:hypothetical protein
LINILTRTSTILKTFCVFSTPEGMFDGFEKKNNVSFK